MANRNPTGTGTFCWYELATSDPQVAKRFYADMFGWAAKDMPLPAAGPGGSYTIFELTGKQVGGMYQLGAQMKGVPPHWASYIEVDDIEKSFEKAKGLGAAGLTPVMDVGDMGRSVMVKDPLGAAFALWQRTGGVHGEMLLDQVHGNRCWNELLTTNIDRAGKFYADLFGWRLQSMSSPTGQYTLFTRGDDQIGGMMSITPEMGPMPPGWMIYFHVDSCDRAIETAQMHGAKIPRPAMDVPEVGRFATIIDPQGVPIGVLQPARK